MAVVLNELVAVRDFLADLAAGADIDRQRADELSAMLGRARRAVSYERRYKWNREKLMQLTTKVPLETGLAFQALCAAHKISVYSALQWLIEEQVESARRASRAPRR